MSANWTCWLGTVVGAGLLGWGIKGMVLGTVMDDKRREMERLTSKLAMLTKLANQPPEVRTVEKRVEVPVERVVVKHVEVPVEKVVDRPVDNPEYLARIKALEGEVAVIVGLLPQMAQLQTVVSQMGGRSIEGRVVVPVDNPEHLARIKALEDEVAAIAELREQMAELRAVSAQTDERVVEQQIEPPTEQNGVVPVDNPEHVARIKALEGEVAMIADLRGQLAQLAQLAQLQAASLQAGKTSVEQPIETCAEPRAASNGTEPVASIGEQMEDLDRADAVAPSDEGPAVGESPDDLKQIRGVGPALERFLHKRGVFWFSQVATWSQKDIDKFEFLLPNFSGRIQRENWVRNAQVEYYKKYKQWLGDGEPPNESLDLRAQMAELRPASSPAEGTSVAQPIETSAEPRAVSNGTEPVASIGEQMEDLDRADAVAPSDEGPAVGESPDDLKQIRGVGPALERFLHKRGVFWFSQVATWSQKDIDKFEFLLPNFSGRIQRENWVRNAQVEYYKKYKQWLGDGEPPNASPETP